MLTEEGFKKLFGLIGRNSQGIGTSPLSAWVEKCYDMNSISKQESKKLEKFIDKLYDKVEKGYFFRTEFFKFIVIIIFFYLKVSESFLNSEASGLYELQSMINHSCAPNAEIKFLDNTNTLTLVCLKKIQPGEEIYISYLSECELESSRHTRQKALKENYLFTCECEKCEKQKDDPDVTSDEDLEDDEDDSDEDMDT